MDEFAKLVGDPATQPLFVYDADGSLSGGLWYLYFRRVEKLSDEAARLRATRLGLKEGPTARTARCGWRCRRCWRPIRVRRTYRGKTRSKAL